MKYWWVNHKQTLRQEIQGEYLWSPKFEANGRRSQFYDNMRLANRGDLVFSYANQLIKYIGVVSDAALSAPKPDEFGLTGEYWANEGWRLPVSWTKLQKPISPKEIFNDIKDLFSKKYAPLNEVGNGNQKAYLSEISKELFNRIIESSGNDTNQLTELPLPVFETIEEHLDQAVIEKIENDNQLSDTEKKQLTLSRIGQGTFRKNVMILESCCRITGIENQDLLIASHIKPWRSCQTAAERLDGHNGLLLTPSIDRLFDRGYISFEDNGDLLISNRLPKIDLELLGINRKIDSKVFSERQKMYLTYHRENILLPSL